MAHTRKALVFTVGLVVLLGACRKEGSTDETTNNGPAPYSVSVPAWLLDSTSHEVTFPSNNPSTAAGVSLGRRLFYEKALSDDNSISCGTCHRQEDGFSDPRQFSVGTDGSVGTRQAMGVMDLAWDQYFFWDGRAASLELQAFGPVTNMIEMRNTWPVVEHRLQIHPEYPALFETAFGSPGIDSVRVVYAIAQFERSLVTFNSRFDRFRYEGDSTAMDESEERGMTIFMRGGHCVDCHHAPIMADHNLRNNGLDIVHTDLGLGAVTGNPAHNGRFKVPTLRNIEVTGPYMHDGRFNTLEEVVDFYADEVHVDSPNLDNHMLPWVAGQVNLSPEDRVDLVAFLRTLTDQQFLTNPALSDPN